MVAIPETVSSQLRAMKRIGIFPFNYANRGLSISIVHLILAAAVHFSSSAVQLCLYFSPERQRTLVTVFRRSLIYGMSFPLLVLKFCWFYKHCTAKNSLEMCFSNICSAAAFIKISPDRPLNTVLIPVFISLPIYIGCIFYYSNIVGLVGAVRFVNWFAQIVFICSVVLPFYHCSKLIDRYLASACYQIVADSSRMAVTFERTIVAYEKLYDAKEHLLDFYGSQILGVVVQCFISVTADWFFVMLNSDLREANATNLISLHGIILTYFLFTVVHTCETVKKRAEKFSKLISTYALQDTTGQLLRNPYIRMHFACKKKLKFNVCGCFDVDYGLGCSMVAACVTYLVILVQIDQSKQQ
ncbi:7tm Chemosensory receptor [Nesidiocoris tenuis]|uniref:Gustatory receptor n=1 Tax=Nesidiocoris tenuis TaxID=355587 RepID=A0ABN7AZR4_9HEMI|nr:7tm Chemosensory receptor [Nesidiocoris tenuis]